jgi:hypothetical protein
MDKTACRDCFHKQKHFQRPCPRTEAFFLAAVKKKDLPQLLSALNGNLMDELQKCDA